MHGGQAVIVLNHAEILEPSADEAFRAAEGIYSGAYR